MTMSRIWLVAAAWAASAVVAFGQQRVIQPSPAYYHGTAAPPPSPPGGPVAPAHGTPPAAAAPVHPAGTPVFYAPASGRPAPAPVYAAPPAAAVAEEEEEEGLYWFWGQKWPGLAIGAQIGTLGWGPDLVFGINRYLSLRSGVNFGNLAFDLKLDDVKYAADLNLLSIPLLVDVYPLGDHFRISAGAYVSSGTSMDLEATPDSAVQIGSHTYGPDVVGTLTGKVEVDGAFSYYVGIGFGNPVAEDQRLTVKLDIGVVFQSYDVSLTSDGPGMTAKLDTFREDIVEEEQNLQADFDDFKVYPVVALGLALTF